LVVSAPLLGLGLLMICAGALLVWYSYRGGEGRVETRAAGVFFFGPIPIVFGGGRRMFAVVAALVVLLFVLSLVLSQPGSFWG